MDATPEKTPKPVVKQGSSRLTMDSNPSEFIPHQEEKAMRQDTDHPPLPLPPSFEFKDQLLNILDSLDSELRDIGIDSSTCKELQELGKLLSNVQPNPNAGEAKYDQEGTDSLSLQLPIEEMSNLTHTVDQEPSQSSAGAPTSTFEANNSDAKNGFESEEKSALDKNPEINEYPASLLDTINTQLSSVTISDTPKIIEPPSTMNPLVKDSGEVWLHCHGSNPTATDPGTIFIIHKAKLWVHSSRFYAHTRANPSKLIYELDTDENTLRRVVDWLHYTEAVDLTFYSTDQLLNILIVAVIIRIPKLHNLIVELLIHRHVEQEEGFDPSETVLRKLYQISKEGDGIRALSGYLFAQSGKVNYGAQVSWDIDVSLDVEAWVRSRSGWDEVQPDWFFMGAGAGSRDGKKKAPEKAGTVPNASRRLFLDHEVSSRSISQPTLT
ncbi:hypothetical protein K505DRAFT_364160 [Melanomma pulvis-pyrius CBS 109.77]|uniref:BTB domain-containing protein n=1 Tax=Melanomma pulvis-pyrius CBS 109.77 TaxID=1314802 RepID=A0A6A6X3X7_9PLEO|nr:hypothetical protein K505DRAFT_364160 [Melanomma pulvis-pyrius CBS 109.77]